MLSVRNGRMSCYQRHSQKVSWKGAGGADAMGAPLIGNGQTAFSALHAHYQGPGRQAGPPFGFAWWWDTGRSHCDTFSSALVLEWPSFFFITSPHSLVPFLTPLPLQEMIGLFAYGKLRLRKQNHFTSFTLHKESLCRHSQSFYDHVWFSYSSRPQYDTHELGAICVAWKVLLRNTSL